MTSLAIDPRAIIDDSNFQQFINPVIDREWKSHGLIPRDYTTHPPGYLGAMAEPFPDSLLIPSASQQPLLDAQVADGTSLFDLRTRYYDVLKSLDQDGLGLSHTADTEVLTEKGFVPWPEYNKTDLLASINPITHRLEFQAPTEHHGYEYRDEMIYSTNRRLDFGVTKNHRMYVRKWDERARTLSSHYDFVPAERLGWYSGFLSAPSGFIGTELVELEVVGDRRYDGDDFLALLAVICSDGYAGGSEGTKNKVSFCCFHPDRYSRVAALAQRVGFREQSTRPGVWSRENAGVLANWIRANCYHSPELRAWNKKVPDLVKVASMRQIAVFLDFFGDKLHSPDPTAVYYSTSKRMIDDLQELNLRVSKRGTVTHRAPRIVTFALEGKDPYTSQTRESWELIVGSTDRLCVDRAKHIEREPYKGLVYCATVPNGTLVTRRNGTILISGNCWAFSSTKAVMYLRAIMNEPDVRLSAWWVAGKVKSWRDEGGWGSESLAMIASAGVPAESLCPSYKASYDTQQTRTNAASHLVSAWWDGSDSAARNTQIMISAFLMGLPPVLDFNWWSHSVCGCRVVSLNPLTIDIDNSWGESAGDKGIYRLVGSKAIPDGIVVPRITLPSAA